MSEILINLIDTIIQNRADVKKTQIKKFDQVHREIKQHHFKAYNGSICELLANLIYIETAGLRSHFKTLQEYVKVILIFTLVDLSSKKTTVAQIWNVQYHHYNQFFKENEEAEFLMVSKLFQQILFFLNQQPLFTQFYKNPIFKQKFEIRYEMKFLSDHHECGDMIPHENLNHLNHCYFRQRVSQSLALSIKCSSLLKHQIIYFLDPKQCESDRLSTLDSSYKKMDNCYKKNESPNKKAESPSKKDRRVSIYEIYDHELNFIFLTSDDEEFKGNQKQEIKEISILDIQAQSDEFQILFVTKEEEKIEEQKQLFQELAKMEEEYFFNL